MVRLGKLAGLGLLGILAMLAGCQQAPTNLPLVSPDVLAKADLAYYWQQHYRPDAGETVQKLWRLDENLYALTSQGRLICLDAAAGTLRWSTKVATAAQLVFAPCHADSVVLSASGVREVLQAQPEAQPARPIPAVIINTITRVLVLDRRSGQVRREIDLKFAANTPGSTDGRYFYVGSINGSFYAINLSTGLADWEMSGGDMLSVRPVIFERRLYVASQSGKFMAVAPDADSKHLWAEATDGPLTAEFHVDNRGCFVPSQDYHMYCYDFVTGQELWSYLAQGPLLSDVQVGQRSVYQYARGDRFYALDIATGRKRWDNRQARTVVAVLSPNILALTENRHLLVLDEISGQALMELPMTGLDHFVPNAEMGSIFATSADGHFVCIRAKGAGHLSAKILTGKESPVTASAPASKPASAPAAEPAEAAPAAPAATETPAAPAASEATPAAEPAVPSLN